MCPLLLLPLPLLLLLLAPSRASALHMESPVRPELLEAVLSESLRLNLVQACEGERITLQCPRNTHISVQNSFYGRLVPSRELCPAKGPTDGAAEDTSCDFAEAHSRVQELCRGKRKCRLWVRPEFFGERDPCPGTGKYLQIGYKCSPVSFEDRNFCEGHQTQLGCKPGRRLSVYSAHYGRAPGGQCPAAEDSRRDREDGGRPQAKNGQDCVSDVLPQIARRCHAQPSCSFPADDRFLGSQCALGPAKYLSVIYVCVNEEVFSEAALRGRLEKMAELERELAILRPLQQLPSAPEGPPHSFRHPLLSRHSASGEEGEDWTEGESADYGVEEESGRGEGRGDRREKGPGLAPEEQRPRGRQEEGSLWDTVLLRLSEDKARTVLCAFLGVSLLLILLLSACILAQCRARSKERQRQPARHGGEPPCLRQRAAALSHPYTPHFQRQNSFGASAAKKCSAEFGHLLLGADSCNISPVYVDSDGSNHRLLEAFPPPADLYHGCYVPVGSCGSGSAGSGGGYYARFGTLERETGRTAPGTAQSQRRMPSSLHCYS